MYIAGTLAMMAFAFPYFWMIHQGSVLMLVLATIIGLVIIWAPITAVLGTMFSEVFDATVRYTGVSLGYHIGPKSQRYSIARCYHATRIIR